MAGASPPAAPLKIALVTPYDVTVPGGVAEHVAELRAAFRRLGHEALVLAPGAARGRVEQAADGYRIGRTVAVPSNGSRARISLDPLVLRAVRDLLRRERFDVVHVHAPHTPLLPYLALLSSDAANVATFHAAFGERAWYLAARPALAVVLRRLHARIAVSPLARDRCRRHFGGDYEVIPNGVDLDRFGPAARPFPWAGDGTPRVLFVGRFDEPRKGFADLCRAAALVQRAVPRVRLVVVGPGDPARARRVAAAAGTLHVDLVGRVAREDLPRYYASCDALCAPSVGNESFGLVLLEAMAAGAPLVATAIPGYAAVATADHDALLVPPRDPRAVAAALVRTLTDPGLRARLRVAGRATAGAYAWPAVAPRVLAVYAEARRRAGRAGPRGGRVPRVAACPAVGAARPSGDPAGAAEPRDRARWQPPSGWLGVPRSHPRNSPAAIWSLRLTPAHEMESAPQGGSVPQFRVSIESDTGGEFGLGARQGSGRSPRQPPRSPARRCRTPRPGAERPGDRHPDGATRTPFLVHRRICHQYPKCGRASMFWRGVRRAERFDRAYVARCSPRSLPNPQS